MPYADPNKRKEYLRNYQREWMRKRAAERRAAKVCIGCRAPVSRFAECRECRERRNGWEHKRAERRNRTCPNHPDRFIRRRDGTMCVECATEKARTVRWKLRAGIGPVLEALLSERPYTTAEAAALLNIQRATVHHYIAEWRKAGRVRCCPVAKVRRRGAAGRGELLYRLVPAVVTKAA